MSIYNTLRSLPSHVADMLMKRGFVKDLTPADRDRLDACVEAMAEEWFGASSTVVATMKEEKPKKEKKTKAAVVTAPPGTMDRAYLETRTVSELKELGKDCAAIKGRKPRAELIELVLQHLSGSSPVAAPAEESSEASDEELREEPPPAQPAPTEDKAAKKEKKAKAEKPVKEKKAKPAKKEKKEEAKAEESPAESEDENTVELKSWYHPNEMSKPIGERRKYFIDPKTSELYSPERIQEGQAEWRWDEDSGEILPL